MADPHRPPRAHATHWERLSDEVPHKKQTRAGASQNRILRAAKRVTFDIHAQKKCKTKPSASPVRVGRAPTSLSVPRLSGAGAGDQPDHGQEWVFWTRFA